MHEMPIPAYLATTLHAEYLRLTEMLSTPGRQRDAATIARALHEGYRRGRMDAITDLRTTAQVADELGFKTATGLWKQAKKYGVGWYTGRDWLFTPADVEVLRHRKTTPGRAPRSPESE